MSLGEKIGKPPELTDAEAEAFLRYLTKTETKGEKKKIVDAFLDTPYGRELWASWYVKSLDEQQKKRKRIKK